MSARMRLLSSCRPAVGRDERRVRARGFAPVSPLVATRAAARSALDEVRPVPLAAREEAARDRLLARVELDRAGAVGVQVPGKPAFPPAEREERARRGAADVDAPHPRLDVMAEAADRRG